MSLTHSGPDPDFSKTCNWYDIDFSYSSRPMLRAKCKDNRGKQVFSQINLNKCLTNVNGKLQCAPGGFTGRSSRRDLAPGLEDRHRPKQKQKCTGCESTGDDTIECSCPLSRGGRVDATYSLGEFFTHTRDCVGGARAQGVAEAPKNGVSIAPLGVAWNDN